MLCRLQAQAARLKRRIARECAFEDVVATLACQAFRCGQDRADTIRCLCLQPLQDLDQRLRIAQMRQAATQPAQFVIQGLRPRPENPGAECERGARTADGFSGLVDAFVQPLAFAGQRGLGLLQLLASEHQQPHAQRQVARGGCCGCVGNAA